MRFWSIIFLLSIGIISCKDDECMLECQFDGTVQIDTTWPIPDQQWIVGADSVILIYRDTIAGDTMIFEVDQHDFNYLSSTMTVPCGECGDSVLAREVVPRFDYAITTEDGLRIKLDMNSNRIISKPGLLLQCVDGFITISDDNGQLRRDPFIFDCNSVFDTEDAFEINFDAYRHQIVRKDSLVGNCIVDSLDFFFYADTVTDLPLFSMSREVPVRMFEYKNQCWRFDTVMTR